MKKINLTIIGAGSDLLKPLIIDASSHDLNIQEIKREDWDLSEALPKDSLIEKIIKFNPSQIIFAAGTNHKTDLDKFCTKELIKLIENHIAINTLSFFSIIDILQKSLPQKLDAVHALSSLYGIYGRRTRLPYVVSKHALEALIKCFSLEYPETQFLGYRPGFFETKLTSKNLSFEMQKDISKRIGKKRLGKPEEMHKALINNIKNINPYMTGTFLTIDGGMISGGIFET